MCNLLVVAKLLVIVYDVLLCVKNNCDKVKYIATHMCRFDRGGKAIVGKYFDIQEATFA